MEKFSISEAIKAGWATYKANWKFLSGVLLLIIVLNILGSYLGTLLQSQYPLATTAINIVSAVVQTIMGMGLIKIAIKLLDGEKVEFKELFASYRLFFLYLLASIVSGLIIILGFILLIIPGIILAIRLQFWPYLVLDGKLGPIDALKKSWEMTKGLTLKLFLFDIVIFFLNILGILLLVVGVFVTGPVSTLATAYLYRKLNRENV